MKQNNKLLADFLGLETTEHNWSLFLTQDGMLDLQYDEIWNPFVNWNHLIAVIKKIQTICANEDNDLEKFFLIKDEIPNMENTYNECVKFVEFYNFHGINFC